MNKEQAYKEYEKSFHPIDWFCNRPIDREFFFAGWKACEAEQAKKCCGNCLSHKSKDYNFLCEDTDSDFYCKYWQEKERERNNVSLLNIV